MSDIEIRQAYLKVIDYIGQEVERGGFEKGEKIPSERKLVEMLGIGRNSIREALEILDVLGIVERRQGDGTYIREMFDDWFIQPMALAFMLSDTSRKEIFDFRNMIEVQIAMLAAERITDQEIKDLYEIYEKFSESNDELTNALHDKEFHSFLAKASKNKIIINSYNAMDYMLDKFIYDMRISAFNDQSKDQVGQVHTDIFTAVVNRDPSAASEAMKRHMDIIRKYYN